MYVGDLKDFLYTEIFGEEGEKRYGEGDGYIDVPLNCILVQIHYIRVTSHYAYVTDP